jgi:hypothetical protein
MPTPTDGLTSGFALRKICGSSSNSNSIKLTIKSPLQQISYGSSSLNSITSITTPPPSSFFVLSHFLFDCCMPAPSTAFLELPFYLLLRRALELGATGILLYSFSSFLLSLLSLSLLSSLSSLSSL